MGGSAFPQGFPPLSFQYLHSSTHMPTQCSLLSTRRREMQGEQRRVQSKVCTCTKSGRCSYLSATSACEGGKGFYRYSFQVSARAIRIGRKIPEVFCLICKMQLIMLPFSHPLLSITISCLSPSLEAVQGRDCCLLCACSASYPDSRYSFPHLSEGP